MGPTYFAVVSPSHGDYVIRFLIRSSSGIDVDFLCCFYEWSPAPVFVSRGMLFVPIHEDDVIMNYYVFFSAFCVVSLDERGIIVSSPLEFVVSFLYAFPGASRGMIRLYGVC